MMIPLILHNHQLSFLNAAILEEILGLLLLKRRDSKFEIHLHNDYTNDAIAMVLPIEGFANMFDALEEYF